MPYAPIWLAPLDPVALQNITDLRCRPCATASRRYTPRIEGGGRFPHRCARCLNFSDSGQHVRCEAVGNGRTALCSGFLSLADLRIAELYATGLDGCERVFRAL
jgi:hypothetical protein